MWNARIEALVTIKQACVSVSRGAGEELAKTLQMLADTHGKPAQILIHFGYLVAILLLLWKEIKITCIRRIFYF